MVDPNQRLASVKSFFASVDKMGEYYWRYNTWELQCEQLRQSSSTIEKTERERAEAGLRKYKRFEGCESFDQYRDIYIQGRNKK